MTYDCAMRKRITARDIAREAGVSEATVSYIINNRTDLKISDATRKRVLHLCNLYGYTPSPSAQSLATGKYKSAGIQFGDYGFSISHQQQALELARALQSSLQKASYSTLLMPPITFEDNPYLQKNIDGIICINLSEDAFAVLKENYFVPIVLVDMKVQDTLFYKVYTDFASVLEKAKSLLGTNHVTYVMEAYNNKEYMTEIQSVLSTSLDHLLIADSPGTIRHFIGEHPDHYYVFDHEVLCSYAGFDTGFFVGSALQEGHFAVVRSRSAQDNVLVRNGAKPVNSPEILLPAQEKAQHAISILVNAMDRKEGIPHMIKCPAQ
jgi:transcriptional regulator with XRE-family HTH domain